MVRQTPFCTPNAHITQVYFLSPTNCCVSRYLVWKGHHFLWWALNISHSLSLLRSSAHRERNDTAQQSHSQQQKRTDEELRGGSEVMESHVEQSFSGFNHTVTSSQAWHFHIKIKVISGDNGAGGLRKRCSFRCKLVAPGLLTSGTWQLA